MQSELLEELRASMADDDAPANALTISELAAATGLGRSALKDKIARLRAAGRLEQYRVRRPDAAGRMQLVPAYVLKPEPKRKKRAG